jgi:DNA primase
MPEGEDPDTLVRNGGAAALQPILDDGMDLLERKIQLLERKGWFEGVEHQREALDRLLPTIRAAADPITRDLYLKAVAERTGVSREVLREQAAARAAVPAAPAPDAPSASRGRPVAPVRRRRAGFEVPAERLLLWVLLRDRSWIPKAAAEVPPEWFETPVLRELYEAMLRSPENVQSALFLEQLSPLAQKTLARVDGYEVKYGLPDLDRAFVDACRSLEARPLRKKLDEIKALREGKRITADNFETIVREEREIKNKLSAIFPEELLKRKLRRGDVDAR